MGKFVVRVKGQIVKHSNLLGGLVDSDDYDLIEPVECTTKREATELVKLLKDYEGLATYTSCEKGVEVCVQHNARGNATGFTVDDLLFVSPDYITINDKKVYAY